MAPSKCLAASLAIAAAIPALIFATCPPALAAEPNWSGLYVGVGLGMRSTQTDTSVTSIANNGVNDYPANCAALAQLGPAYGGCVPAQPLNDTGFRVSSYVGFNWEIMPRWIVGIEADLGLSDRSTTLSGMRYPGTMLYTGVRADQFTVSTKWDASARGRVGFLVNPSILVYATGGAAWLRVESSSSCDISINAACSPAVGSGPVLIRDSATKLGWTVGGGVEAMLLSNWILRGEYRYADFGTISHTDQRYLLGGGIEQVVSYDLDVKTHLATLGLAYKFGGDQGAASSRTLPAASVVASSWSGLYLGAGLGVRSSRTDASITGYRQGNTNVLALNCAGAALGGCVTDEPLNDTALRINPYVGFNWQIAPQWVVGIEGDFGFADKTTTLGGMNYPFTGLESFTGRLADTFAVRTIWDASARGRVGYLVHPSVLLYGTGGAAWLHVESTSTCSQSANNLCSPGVSSGPLVITNESTKLGWTAGGGFDAMLSPNWIARAEYRYADFGTIANTDNRGGPLSSSVSYDLYVKTHTALLGLAYKLD
jgi:outer membrane immunogenic protein